MRAHAGVVPTLLLSLLSAADLSSATRPLVQEERLIGWLGEVPRPQSMGGSVHSGSAGRTDSTELPVGAARFPEHDASRLDTRFIGVGNPNVEQLSEEPRAYLWRGFLTRDEAEHLVKLGEPHLKRSTVVGAKDDTGEDNGNVDTVRTSHGCFLPKEYDDVLYSVERRVEQYSQIPYENQEQLQILRYNVGQQYKDHMDGLFSDNGGRRIATVLMFLREPDSGGETSFPYGNPFPATKQRMAAVQSELSSCGWRDGRGMSVKPRVGDAILFFSFTKNGDSDPASMHASCPTLVLDLSYHLTPRRRMSDDFRSRSWNMNHERYGAARSNPLLTGGTKWTATKWLHEKTFNTGVWKKPECVDTNKECSNWARGGECKKNPGFMLGAETPGNCIKSCCGEGDAELPVLSPWQKIFCASCGGKL